MTQIKRKKLQIFLKIKITIAIVSKNKSWQAYIEHEPSKLANMTHCQQVKVWHDNKISKDTQILSMQVFNT